MTRSTKTQLGTRNIALGILAVITAILSSQNEYMGYIVVVIQVLAFIFLLAYRSEMVLPFFIFSLGSSLEFNAFVNDGALPLYNLSNVRIVGMNIGVYMLALTGFSFLLVQKSLVTTISFVYAQALFLLLLYFMYSQAITLTLFDYFISHSQLAKFDLSHVVGIAYLQLWPFILILMFIFYIKTYKNGLYYLKCTIAFTLLTTLIASLIINTLGFRGTYGSSPYYLSPTLIFLAPFILLILKDPIFNLKYTSIFLIFAILILCPIIFFDLAGGKILLFSIMAIVLSSRNLDFKRFVLFLTVIFLAPIVVIGFSEEGTLLQSKIDEVISLFNFVSNNWYILLQPSTRFRIDELINIYQHYAANPINVISGFGIAGGAPDYIGGYGFIADGSFPQTEYSNDHFISYHELSSFLIKYGLTGLVLILFLCIYAFKYNNRSYFIAVGVVWFLFFWGYSQTLAVIGAAILAVGIMEVRTTRSGST